MLKFMPKVNTYRVSVGDLILTEENDLYLVIYEKRTDKYALLGMDTMDIIAYSDGIFSDDALRQLIETPTDKIKRIIEDRNYIIQEV